MFIFILLQNKVTSNNVQKFGNIIENRLEFIIYKTNFKSNNKNIKIYRPLQYIGFLL